MKSGIKSLSLIPIVLFCTSLNAAGKQETLDLNSDDFEVFRHIGKTYLDEAYKGKLFSNSSEFGIGFTSYGKDPYPKTGFIGYELMDDKNTEILVKLQLYKNAQGWKLERVLDNSKIDQANPVYTHVSGHARSDQTIKAEVAAAAGLEDWLNKKKLIKQVRATSMSCYVTKNADFASCHGIYGVKSNGEIKCQSKSYLLKRTGAAWQIAQDIGYDQKVSYTNGELVKRKPFTMHCN